MIQITLEPLNHQLTDQQQYQVQQQQQQQVQQQQQILQSQSTNTPIKNGVNDQSTLSDVNKRKQHNCPYCDRSFTRPYRLNDHISFSHTDEVFY